MAHPLKFLEVVHFDIGFGGCKSVGNGTPYCHILADHATHYTLIYGSCLFIMNQLINLLSNVLLIAGVP